MEEEGGNADLHREKESLGQVSTMTATGDLGSTETDQLSSIKLQVFSNDLILEKLCAYVDTSQLTTLRQVSKVFYLGTLNRWQAECTISIHGNMDKCEDFLREKQKHGLWPLLGISNVEQALTEAPSVFGVGEEFKSYTFRKIRIYGFVMRCQDDGDFWRRMGSTLEELTIVNGLATWEEVAHMMRVTPKLVSLSIRHLIPFFPKARDVFVSKPWLRQGDNPWIQAKIKRFSFKGSVATWFEFRMNSFDYISKCQSISIEWVPEKEERNLALEWAHLIYPYMFDLSEHTHRDENGFLWKMTLIPHSGEKYKIHPYPIPEWVSEREGNGRNTLPIYPNPSVTPICDELEFVSLDAYGLRDVAPILSCVSLWLKLTRLTMTSTCCPLAHRDSSVAVFQSSELDEYGHTTTIQSRFELLTYLKLSLVMVPDFNFILNLPILKCLIIENATHRKALHSKNLDDDDDLCERLRCCCFSGELGDRPPSNLFCGNKVVRQSYALEEDFTQLSLLQFQVDMHFDVEHMSVIRKWFPNIFWININA